MEEQEKWDNILKFLRPVEPLYCPETMSPTQSVFLRYNGLEALFGGSAGGGKLLTLSEILPTPSGWISLRDVRPGQILFGRDGNPCVVLAESEVQHVDGWRFTFDDGSTVDSNDEHLWLTYDAKELGQLTRHSEEWRAARRAKRPSRAKGTQGTKKSEAVAKRNAENRNPIKPTPLGSVKTTKQIVDTLLDETGRRNHAIPVAASLQLPEKELLIDPYVLGVWLGDGTSASGSITSMDDEIIDAVINADFTLKAIWSKKDNQASTFNFNDLKPLLNQLQLLNNKHIPHDYLWASEDQRAALLQGLLDTDGTVTKSGSAEFCNANKEIADGFAHLVRSLGMKATIREGRAKLNGKDYGPKWTIKFMANRPVFRLKRKLALQKIATRRTTQFRYIVSAERIEPVEMKCLKVSSPDNLFLVTENFIPTHNSSALLMAALQYVDVPGYNAWLFRRTFADLALPGALMDRFKMWISNYDDIKWNANDYVATFPSGARVGFGYLNNANDYLRYKGSELQFCGMDEVSEIRQFDYEYLFSRLRRPKKGPLAQVPLRMRAATNPAPNWVRQRFIVEGKDKGIVFVPSRLTDNPGIDAASYRQSLSMLNATERARLEDGDWWATTLGSKFAREKFIPVTASEIPQFGPTSKIVRYWDLAATVPRDDYKDPDWTVGTLMLFSEGRVFVLDVVRDRLGPDEVQKLVKRTALEDGIHVPIRMEQEPGSSGVTVINDYKKHVLPGFDFNGIASTSNKILKSQPFAAAVANDTVFIQVAKWNSDWLDEMTSFPEAATHDDQVDSASGAYSFVTGIYGKQKTKIKLLN